jgi:hypothetical protein
MINLMKYYSAILFGLLLSFQTTKGVGREEKIDFILNSVQKNIILYKVYLHYESIRSIADSSGMMENASDYLFDLILDRGCVLDLQITESDWKIPETDILVYEITKHGDVAKCGDNFLMSYHGHYPYRDDTKFLVGYDTVNHSIIYISGMFFSSNVKKYFLKYRDDVEMITRYLYMKFNHWDNLKEIKSFHCTREFIDFEFIYINKKVDKLRLFKSNLDIKWLD